jgi:hypothetical protein
LFFGSATPSSARKGWEIDFRVFCISNLLYFKPPNKAVILSEALRRSIANGGLYGAESKDPGDACWQMLVGAFRPQTTTEDKKVTNPERSRPVPPAPGEPWGVPWRDLQFRGPSLERFFDCVIPALISLENIFYTQKRAAISPPVGDALRHRSNR